MKKILFIIACLTSVASADDKADAQHKIDEGKVKGCEAFKGLLAKNKTCPDQTAAAAKITCTPATYNEMSKLFTDCSAASQAKSAAAADAAKAKAAAPKDISCKATDDAGASFYDQDNARMTGCMKEVKAAAVKAKCGAGAKKAKVTYAYAGKKPLNMTVLCPK
jgi:hypothetical protein